MGVQARSVSRPWWHSLRFSLQALIILVLMIGLGLGCAVHLIRGAHCQRDTVAAIERSGGTVWYDWEWKDDRPIPNGKPRWPKWLVDRVGVDYFGHVVSVVFAAQDGRLSDSELAAVRPVGRLENLYLSSSSVTDAGLSQIEDQSSLESLWLDFSQVSDGGLSHLKRLTSLKRLCLCGTKVTDAGVAQLKGLANLEGLDLRGTMVTDGAITHLRELKRLRWLYLTGSEVTPAGVQSLQEAFPQLAILR